MDTNPVGAAPAKTKCLACGEDVNDGAKMCGKCKFPLGDVQPCRNCGRLMPQAASFCNECKSYKKLRYFPVLATVVALFAALIGVISALIPAVSYFLDRDSHTTFKVTSSDKDHVVLKAWNTGRKPSTLIGYRLIFNSLPAKEMILDLSHSDKLEAKNVIAPGTPVKIALTNPLPTMIPQRRRGKQYTQPEFDDLRKKPLSDLSMTLEIDVEESNDAGSGDLCPLFLPLSLMEYGSWYVVWPRQVHTRSDVFQADRIQEFIEQKM
jgi:hypothetical protein